MATTPGLPDESGPAASCLPKFCWPFEWWSPMCGCVCDSLWAVMDVPVLPDKFRQCWVSLEAKSRVSETTSSSACLSAAGDLTDEQVRLIQESNLLQISDQAMRAGFPSVGCVVQAAAGMPPPARGGGMLGASAGVAGASGQGTEQKDAEKKDKKVNKPKKERSDILDEQGQHVLTPQTCKAVQAEWAKRFLSDIGDLEKLHVQLASQAYAKELAADLAAQKCQLEAARQRWLTLPAPLKAEDVEALGADRRTLVTNVRRLATKAMAMLREPGEGKPKAKKAKTEGDA